MEVGGLAAAPGAAYRALRAGQAGYESHKLLAPDATFRFAVLAPAGVTLPADFRLALRTRNGREVPVALEHGGLFQLPALAEPDVEADLVSNLPDGRLRIGVLVLTPGVPAQQERLGDLRLRSRIFQAMSDADHTNEDRGWLFSLLCGSGCRPLRPALWQAPGSPATGAWVVDRNHAEPLESRGGPAAPSYRIPLPTRRLSDDALIAFDRPNAPALPLPDVAVYGADD